MSERREISTRADRPRPAPTGLIAVGGVLGAIAAARLGVGIGGAWMGNLSALSPYQLGV